MRHLKKHNKLNRSAAHRQALVSNLCCEIIKRNRIKTTKAKAKLVKPIIERLITRAKNNTLANKRIVAQYLRGWSLVPKLFNDIAPSFKERAGGYSRIIKLGFRESDSAEIVYIELLHELKKSKTPAEPAKKKV